MCLIFKISFGYCLFKSISIALVGVAQWIERGLWTKGSLVRFLVRSHTWIVGQVPSEVHVRGNHTLMFLSLFLPPFPSLKINLKNLEKKTSFKKKKYFCGFICWTPNYPTNSLLHPSPCGILKIAFPQSCVVNMRKKFS